VAAVQVKDIQLLASNGPKTKQKILPSQRGPCRAAQRGDFESLSWLEVVGTCGSGSDHADPWQQLCSAWAVARQPLRLTALSVLLLDNLTEAVQLPFLVSCLASPQFWQLCVALMLDYLLGH
jgi:hypothetical protein